VRASADTFRLEKDAEIWLAAAVEGVLREALRKVGDRATRNKTSRGRPYVRNRVLEENLDWLGQEPDFDQLVQALRQPSAAGPTTGQLQVPAESTSLSSGSDSSTTKEVARDDRTRRTSPAKWQYEDNGWKDYDAEASEEVEKCYQTYLSCPGQFDVRSVKSGTWHYQVDFPQMIQTNIRHENHTRRAIRRISI
jgi:hypothetical protein